MRRVASIFSTKRSDRSDATPSVVVSETSHSASSTHDSSSSSRPKSRFLNLGSHLNVSTTPLEPLGTPQLTVRDPVNSASSASSSGSASLRTPDDDAIRTSGKKHWISWLAGKKSGTVRRHEESHRPEWEGVREAWSRPAPVLHTPPSRNQIQAEDDSEEDTSSESDEDGSEACAPRPAGNIVTPPTIAQARTNLRILSTNGLVPQVSSPPLLHLPGPPFPRSCSNSRFLQTPSTMEIAMHRRRLLHHLDHDTLSRAEELAIIPLGSRPQFPVSIQQSPGLDRVDTVAPDAKRISLFSQGLKQWVARSCFEDRMAVWVPDEQTGALTCRTISGTGFGVAALEFSEALESLSGTVIDSAEEFEFEPEFEPPSSAASSTSQLSSSGQSRSAPYKALPSPLRIEHGPTAPLVPPVSTGPKSDAAPQPMPVPVAAKRGVRFAEDDKDDQIPLGYVLRIKKSREEKAKFLREERERRVFEEEKSKIDEERQKREKERREWEKERKSWEKEKKAMEESKKQRLYAEEVAAARMRRDRERSGMVLSSSSTSLQELDRPKVRESSRISRPGYDLTEAQRRQNSDPVSTGSSPYTPSPGSSHSPSLAGGISPGASGSNRSSVIAPPSRPASNYTSSEDGRLTQTQVTSSKRNSPTFESSHFLRPPSGRMNTYPNWSTASFVPAVPPMPMFAMDVPLLPPTPPFMMQQYGYRPRQNSRDSGYHSNQIPSPSSSPRHTLTTSHSSDRVTQSSQRQSSSSPSRPEHQRRSSDEAAMARRRPEQRVSAALDRDRRSSSHPTLPSTGRAHLLQPPMPMPLYTHPLNPWTAPLPVPIQMQPPRGRPAPNRRQSVIT